MTELLSFVSGIGLGISASLLIITRQRASRLRRVQSMLNHPSFSEVIGFSSDGKGNFYSNTIKSDWITEK
jgi:hypothetical protein